MKLALALALASAAAAQEPSILGGEVQHAQAVLTRQRLHDVFNQYLAQLESADPEAATRWGGHRGDDRLTLPDDETRRRLERINQVLHTKLHNEVEEDALSPEDRRDHDMFWRHLELVGWLQKRRDVRALAPWSFLRLDEVVWPLHKEYDSIHTNGPRAIARLKEVPRVLAQGKALTGSPPRDWTEHTILLCEGAREWLGDIPRWAAQAVYPVASGLKLDLEPTAAAARAAVTDYQDYLKSIVLFRSIGDFRIDPEVYQRLLAVQGVEQSPSSVRRACARTAKRARKELKRAARQIERKKEWHEILYELGSPAPAVGEVLGVYADEARRLRAAVEADGAPRLLGGKLRILMMPQYMRLDRPAVLYSGSGRMDDHAGGVLYVGHPMGLETPEEAEALLRLVGTRSAAQAAIAREVWPGRHVAAEYLKAPKSPIRRYLGGRLLEAGWGLYAADAADRAGTLSAPAAKLAVLRDRMLAGLRCELDVDVNTGGASVDEAVERLMEEAALPRTVARAEVLRLTKSPAESAAAVLGYEELSDAREEAEGRLGRRFTLPEYHERLLRSATEPLEGLGSRVSRRWASEAGR